MKRAFAFASLACAFIGGAKAQDPAALQPKLVPSVRVPADYITPPSGTLESTRLEQIQKKLDAEAEAKERQRRTLLQAAQADLYRQIQTCWLKFEPRSLLARFDYVPQIKAQYDLQGVLTDAKLLNPTIPTGESRRPDAKELLAFSEATVRVVQRCSPLNVTASLRAFPEGWRTTILRFDPKATNKAP